MAEAEAQTIAQAAVAPKQGEPCEECGAPLAADQRYCLNCGRRRAGPRVDYRHYMGAAASGEPARPASAQPPAEQEQEQASKPQRDYAPLAAVGGIAVLGLMLLIGVLIGKGNNDTAAAPTPQVIRVPAAAEGSSAAEGGSSKNTGAGLGGGGAKKAKQSAGANSGGTGSAVKASEGDLESLSSESGADYEKKSKELPDEIATPGAPPPIDKSTAPGGGEGGAEVIK